MEPTNLEQRLAAIEDRLTKLEAGIQREESASPYQFAEDALKIPNSPPASPFTTPAQTSSDEWLISKIRNSNWLGIISMICFVFAAVLIIKLAIDYGTLSIIQRLGLAYLLGISLIISGFLLLSKDRSYASLLPSAGIIILYLTTYGAYRYYGLMTFNDAVLVTSAVSALCVFIYFSLKQEIYPITAAIGAYLSPIILLRDSSTIYFTAYYFTICSLAFAFISLWMRSRILIILSAYLAVINTAMYSSDFNQHFLTAVSMPVQLLIFSVALILFSYKHKQPLSKEAAWSIFPLLMIFYANEYNAVSFIYPETVAWLAVGFGLGIAGIALIISYKNRSPTSLAMLASVATIVLFHAIYIELLTEFTRPWLAIAIITCAALLPEKYMRDNKKSIFQLVIIAGGLIVTIQYINLIFDLLGRFNLENIAVGIAMSATFWLYFLNQKLHTNKDVQAKYLILSITNLLAVILLYRIFTDISSLAVSASWLFYAVTIIALATIYKDKIIANSAVFVLCLSAAKALLLDASSAPTGVRILCLLLNGVVLYGAGLMMRHFSNWDKKESD